jgi:threonine synthase
MKYLSTRGRSTAVSFSEAVEAGLAPDGGLFLPEELPDISPHLKAWESLSYAELTAAFFQLFATDLDAGILKDCVLASYGRFDHPEVAPLKRLGERLFVLELFHGPTLAFKDFALQLLGNLYEEQMARTGKPINVLGATSGDTGAAAIHGLRGKRGVNIFILYPDGRVSPLQERQMTCTGSQNIFPLAIEGSFDDAQKALKETFEDLDFRENLGLSAVNSINMARIIAQCVYYLYAWFRLPEESRETVEFVVPTGNFGNVLAGWMAQKMGLPVAGFRVATNQNDILHRFFQSGVYEMGEVKPSHAPSMDIQVASNFERFIYYAVDRDSAQVRRIMRQFKETGFYRFENFDADTFSSSCTDDNEIEATIGRVHREYGYLIDPHTACGFSDLNRNRTSVVLATAHPAKFPDTILAATGQEARSPVLDALKTRDIVKFPIAADKAAIQAFIKDHAVTCHEMEAG